MKRQNPTQRVDKHIWIPIDLMNGIAKELEKRPGVSTTFWILEAIKEKLCKKNG